MWCVVWGQREKEGRRRRRRSGNPSETRTEEQILTHLKKLLLFSKPFSLFAGGIADVVENANAMAARTDTTKKVTGSQKRDVDYLAEYASYVNEYETARTAAEKSGAAFDDGAVLGKIKGALGIASIDAELDAKK